MPNTSNKPRHIGLFTSVILGTLLCLSVLFNIYQYWAIQNSATQTSLNQGTTNMSSTNDSYVAPIQNANQLTSLSAQLDTANFTAIVTPLQQNDTDANTF